ncbi:nicotinamide riboside transporter PnuC [Novosphingobium sp.]|uniref:nicotinamide riboside transporter PnuC n=1 Tax=Novosphingobium sp. TaxID=1874826 RepID=UPI00286DD1E1|nr:nicotinamide riboside transporter PnuC [Novosphingobium sp.]
MIVSSETLFWLEWAAAGFGVMNIALLIFRSHWNYLFGLVMVALYFFVFWEQALFAEAVLQVFFFAAQGWGWWLWLRVGGGDNKVEVRWLDWRSRWVWLVAMAAISVNLSWLMEKYTTASAPWIDTPIAVFSVGAQILLAFRRIENWVLWVVIDVVSIWLYIMRDLEPTAGLYGGFLVMSLFGLKEWTEAARKTPEAERFA